MPFVMAAHIIPNDDSDSAIFNDGEPVIISSNIQEDEIIGLTPKDKIKFDKMEAEGQGDEFIQKHRDNDSMRTVSYAFKDKTYVAELPVMKKFDKPIVMVLVNIILFYLMSFVSKQVFLRPDLSGRQIVIHILVQLGIFTFLYSTKSGLPMKESAKYIALIFIATMVAHFYGITV